MSLPAMILDGDVIAAHSHWTDDGSRIVTEATVRTADGQEIVVSQLGGSVGGIGMITIPGPAMLEPGMRVAVAAHMDRDLAQREHVVLDSVKVLAYPPGYVRTGPTKAGHYLFWESGCVFVTVDDAGTAAISGDGEFPVIEAAIGAWNDGAASCSYLRVVNSERKAQEVGNDKVNAIKFRDKSWGRPAVGDDPARTYSPNAAGLTTVVYIDDADSPRDGAILDADVELNGVDFTISIDGQTGSNEKCPADLQNTLTHELGHLQGLEHPCYLEGVDPMRVDDAGDPVPSCSPLNPPEILEATMYPTQACGETSKSTLSADDTQAICDIYPVNQDPGTCDPVGSPTGGGCCSASGGRDRPAGTLLLAGVTALLLMRRRKTARDA